MSSRLRSRAVWLPTRRQLFLLVGTLLVVIGGLASAGTASAAHEDPLQNPSCESSPVGPVGDWSGSSSIYCDLASNYDVSAPAGEQIFVNGEMQPTSQSISENVTAYSGTDYRVSGSYGTDFFDSSPDKAEVVVEFYDFANSRVGSATVLPASESDGTWTDFSKEITAPSGTDSMRITLRFIQRDGGYIETYYDDISVTEVNDAPSVDTNTGLTVDEGSSGTAITTSNLSASDADGDSLTYAVTDAVDNGTLFVDGSGDGTDDGTLDGESPVGSGTFTQSNIENGNLLYTHDGSEADSEQFAFEVRDGNGGTVTGQTFSISVANVNDAPVLSSDERNLTPIPEDSISPSGDTVASIFDSAGTASDADGDSLGVVVTDVGAENGDWQYSTDGFAWNGLPSEYISESSALLLASDDKLRFEPDPDFDGTASLTVRAWDGSSGSANTVADTTTNGGETAYSSTAVDATVRVLDAPEVTDITRVSPGSPTSAENVTFDVTFSESVVGVVSEEFRARTVTGTANGNVSSVGSSSGRTVSVTVDTVTGDGELGLALRDSDAVTADGVPLGGEGTVGPGNGSYAGGQTFEIDNTLPPAPTGLDLEAGSDTGVSSSDNLTRETTPTISGNATPSITVTVYSDRDGALGTTTAGDAGAWSFTPDTALSEGTHNLTATATDALGNEGTASNVLSVTVDTTPPSTPVRPSLTADSDSGVSATDNVTNTTTPTLTGSAEAGTNVTLRSDRDGQLVTLTATDGTYSFTPETALSEGTHSIIATASDAAGNSIRSRRSLSLTVDTTAPAAPSDLRLDTASDTGESESDNLTSDPTPTITGTAEAGTVVTLRSERAGTLGTTTADETGSWSFTPDSPLSERTHSVTANATDTAGNAGPTSTTLAVTVDTTAPSVTAIRRSSPTTRTTNADSVVFTVTFSERVVDIGLGSFALAPEGASGTLADVGSDAGRQTTVTVTGVTGDGPLELVTSAEPTVMDPAGNALDDGVPSATEAYVIDNTAPTFTSSPSPTINESRTGSVIDIDAVETGAETADANVTYRLAGDDAGPFSLDSSTGDLSLDTAQDFEAPNDTDGDNGYDLTVTATDDLGNTGTQSLTVSVVDVNEPPTVVRNAVLRVTEGESGVELNSSRLATTDPEQSATALTFTVTDGVDHGTLFVDGRGGGTVDGTRDGEPALGTGQFTQAALDDGRLRYVHDDSDTLRDSFSFTVGDGNGAGTTGTTFDIAVEPVSDGGGGGATTTSFVRGDRGEDGRVRFTVPRGDSDRVVLRVIAPNAPGGTAPQSDAPVRIERLTVSPTDGFATEETVSARAWATGPRSSVSDRTTDLLVSTGVSALGHVVVSESQPFGEIEDATVALRVRKRYLEQQDVSLDSTAIYAEEASGWTRLATSVVRETDSYYVLEADASGLRSIALGANTSAVDIDEASLNSDRTTVSESVSVSASVRNRGLSQGTETVELRANGSVVDSETVAVAAEDSERVTLSFSPNDTGAYRLSVGSTAVGTIRAASADTGGATPPSDTPSGDPSTLTPTATAAGDNGPQTTDNTGTTGGSGPGFTLFGAVVALSAGVVLARRRG